MKSITLGATGLEVFPLVLGTGEYGVPPFPPEKALAQLDLYTSLGGNFIDTAAIYNDWIPGERSRSEKLIGQWLRSSGARNDLVISTKGGHPSFEDMQKGRIRPEHLEEDLRSSLERLQTDYADLYFLHRDDVSVPVGEVIDYLEEKKAAGLIRAYGFSNWTLKRAKQAHDYAQQKGIDGFTVNQLYWSLARVQPEHIADTTLVPMSEAFHQFHVETGMAAMAYTSQAKGYLSKRYLNKPLSDSLSALYECEHNQQVLNILTPWCEAHDLEPSQAIVRWFRRQPFPAVPIVSPSSETQLRQLMDAAVTEEPALPEGLPVW